MIRACPNGPKILNRDGVIDYKGAKMPRFFFNYREHDEYTVDDTGVDFETFELAYLDGFNAAGQMWPEIMARRVDPRTCAFEILDSSGNLLAILNFNELLENCGPRVRVATHDIKGALASE
jgi:hypothetical protein